MGHLFWHHLKFFFALVVALHHVSGKNKTEEKSSEDEKMVVGGHEASALKEMLENTTAAYYKIFKSSATYSNCAEVQLAGHRTSGIYLLEVFGQVIEVYCDLTTDGGGWTVLQRRADFPPPINFYRDWLSYKTGFGDLNQEFWLGLDHIHRLTASEPSSLLIELQDFAGVRRKAKYDRFYAASEENIYQLYVTGYSGNAGDSFSAIHNRRPFSTWDRDNDLSSKNCAELHSGGWWYARCHHSNLNGKYLRGNHTSFADGVEWYTWKGFNYSLEMTEMKIRPVEF